MAIMSKFPPIPVLKLLSTIIGLVVVVIIALNTISESSDQSHDRCRSNVDLVAQHFGRVTQQSARVVKGVATWLAANPDIVFKSNHNLRALSSVMNIDPQDTQPIAIIEEDGTAWLLDEKYAGKSFDISARSYFETVQKTKVGEITFGPRTKNTNTRQDTIAVFYKILFNDKPIVISTAFSVDRIVSFLTKLVGDSKSSLQLFNENHQEILASVNATPHGDPLSIGENLLPKPDDIRERKAGIFPSLEAISCSQVVSDSPFTVVATTEPFETFRNSIPLILGIVVLTILAAASNAVSHRKIGRLVSEFRDEHQELVGVEEALRQSEKRLLHHIQNTPLGYILWDRNFICTEWNKAAEKIFGFSADEAIGRHASGLIVPDELHEELDSVFKSLLEQKGGIHSTNENTNKDGEFITCDWHNTPIVNEKGKVTGVASLVLDVTDSIKAEAALHESEEKFRALSEIGTDWFWESNNEHRLVKYAGYRAISGLPKEGSTGIRIWENASKQDLMDTEKWTLHKAQLNAHEKFRDFEYELASDPPEWVRMSGDPIFDKKGAFRGYQGISTIITERKRLEGQLRQSQRMEAVGQLTGGIAHDFNNLLTVMLGNSEMLNGKIGYDEFASRHLNNIMQAVDRASSLTDRLLTFSRQQTLTPVSADVQGLIDGLIEMLQRSLGETIELKVDHNSDLWTATIDPHQFENALINLALNARDAMEKGGLLLIETSNVTLDETFAGQYEEVTPGDYVKVAVTDTGNGIASEVLDKVFEPFFTTKGVGEGSGLGLSMVFGFAKQSNGHVTINSEAGHGTTVELYMPRSGKTITSQNTKDYPPKFERGLERILIVEDNESVRDVPVSILRDQGYEIVEAGDGKEAIKQLKNNPPFNLLFTDVVLPGGMNGVEIAEQAKILQPNIKILYTSGHADIPDIHKGKLDQDVALINKPYLRAELLERVRAILDSENPGAIE